MAFKAEVYAIKACTFENIEKGHHNRNIYILSHSEATIKAPNNYKTYSMLVWDCHQTLMILAECNSLCDVGTRT
jgi:hypothetical protein